MTADSSTLSDHPSPQRSRASVGKILFGLVTGPLAWFVQFCIGYGLVSTPCFRGGARIGSVMSGDEWTKPVTITISIAALLLALAGLAVAWRIFSQTRHELEGSHHEVMEIGSGRSRFLALWGICLSAGAAVTILASGVAFAVLPRCAG